MIDSMAFVETVLQESFTEFGEIKAVILDISKKWDQV